MSQCPICGQDPHPGVCPDALKMLERAQSMREPTARIDSVADAVAQLDAAASGLEKIARAAWEAGFELCRSYGDNHVHFQGAQKERQWQAWKTAFDADAAAKMTEAITWHPVADGLPDSDRTVMGYRATGWDEPTGQCYHDGEHWRSMEGLALTDANVDAGLDDVGPPTHWADMPAGPQGPVTLPGDFGDVIVEEPR